jgi:hypothetical protein
MAMTTGHPGKQSAEEARKEQAPVPTVKKNKLQQTNNHPPQITITNRFEALRRAGTEEGTKHEKKKIQHQHRYLS